MDSKQVRVYSTNLFCKNLSGVTGISVNGSSWRKLWSIKAPPKVLAFLWKVKRRVLPTGDFLNRRINSIQKSCGWCGAVKEDIDHIFWHCDLAQMGWNFLANWWGFNKLLLSHSFSLDFLFSFHRDKRSKHVWQMTVIAVMWSIWLARNEWVFRNKKISKLCLQQIILARINKWGAVEDLIPFSKDPLWLSNPLGAIKVYFHRLNSSFWINKRNVFELICAVSGSWNLNSRNELAGGIGGKIWTKEGVTYHVFAGKRYTACNLHSEVEAIRYILELVSRGIIYKKPIVICSSSVKAVGMVNNGLIQCNGLLMENMNLAGFLNNGVFVQFVPPELNEDAGSLAIDGLDKELDFSYWADSC